MKRVAVLTVTHDSRAVIDAYCAGIDALRADGSVDVECVVVDQDSHDDTVARLRGVTIVRNPRNTGFARGCIDAIGALRDCADALLFLNPDVALPPAALRTLLQALAADRTLAAVTPLLRGADGVPRVPARPLVHKSDAWSFLSGTRRARQRRIDRWSDAHTITPLRDAYAEGSCLLVRRTAYDAVGGFDPRFFVYFEDVDLCRRLEAAGGRLALVPDAVAIEAACKGSRAARDSNAPGAEELARYLLFLDAEVTYFAKWYGVEFARFAAWMRRTLALRLQRRRLVERFGSATAIEACARVLREAVARL